MDELKTPATRSVSYRWGILGVLLVVSSGAAMIEAPILHDLTPH